MSKDNLYFCTLFDSNYLAKGVLTIRSLLNVCHEAHVFVLAMDKLAFDLMGAEDINRVHLVALPEFENADLLTAKSNRSNAEYCWTCGSAFVYYCITKYNLPSCVYIDADLYFYASPEILLEEIGNRDVMITEHRYTTRYDASSKSGKYCVQFMYFRNSPNGMYILKWWRDRCLEWCYAKFEDGKFGDQKYLDDWLERFEGVHVLRYEGGGLAPWNIQQYEMSRDEDNLIVRNKTTGDNYKLVFYHFHHLRNYRLRGNNEFRMGPYPISDDAKRLMYKPYIKELIAIYGKYGNNEYDPLGSVLIEIPEWKYVLHRIKAIVYPKDKIIWHG